MTARIVITSTLHHARHKPRHHRESDIIPGTASCGTILRRPHRAIAVDDGGLCAACWPAAVKQAIHKVDENIDSACGPVSMQLSDRLGRIETAPAEGATSSRGLTTQPAVTGDMAMSHRNAAHPPEAI